MGKGQGHYDFVKMFLAGAVQKLLAALDSGCFFAFTHFQSLYALNTDL